MKKIYPFIGMGLALLVSTGCVAGKIHKTEQTNKRALLDQRIDDYLSAKNAGDVEKEYEFFDPSSKKSLSLAEFVEMRGSSSTKSVIESIDYVPGSDNASVCLRSDIVHGVYKLNKIRSQQDWVFSDGNWYLHIEKRSGESLFRPRPGSKRK